MARKLGKPLVWLKGEVKTPMPTIGTRCHELRITDRGQTWRIVYHVALDAVVILDVFGNKTEATPAGVLDTCRTRLATYLKVMSPKERR